MLANGEDAFSRGPRVAVAWDACGKPEMIADSCIPSCPSAGTMTEAMSLMIPARLATCSIRLGRRDQGSSVTFAPLNSFSALTTLSPSLKWLACEYVKSLRVTARARALSRLEQP